jgi:hypothetical protein
VDKWKGFVENIAPLESGSHSEKLESCGFWSYLSQQKVTRIGAFDEEDISATQYAKEKDPWLSLQDEKEGWAEGACTEAGEGPVATYCQRWEVDCLLASPGKTPSPSTGILSERKRGFGRRKRWET